MIIALNFLIFCVISLLKAEKVTINFQSSFEFISFLERMFYNISLEFSKGKYIEVTLSEFKEEIELNHPIFISAPTAILGRGNIINLSKNAFIECASSELLLLEGLIINKELGGNTQPALLFRQIIWIIFRRLFLGAKNSGTSPPFMHFSGAEVILFEFVQINYELGGRLIEILHTSNFHSLNFSLFGLQGSVTTDFEDTQIQLLEFVDTIEISLINFDARGFGPFEGIFLLASDANQVVISHASFQDTLVKPRKQNLFQIERTINKTDAINIFLEDILADFASSFNEPCLRLFDISTWAGSVLIRNVTAKNLIAGRCFLVISVSKIVVSLENLVILNCSGLQTVLDDFNGEFSFINATLLDFFESPVLQAQGSAKIFIQGALIKNFYSDTSIFFGLFRFKNFAKNQEGELVVTFQNCAFLNSSVASHNEAANHESSLFLHAEGKIFFFVTSSSFFENSAVLGSVVFYIGLGAEAFFEKVFFVRNSVIRGAFAGASAGKRLEIIQCTFIENIAKEGNGILFKGEKIIYQRPIFFQNGAYKGAVLFVPNQYFENKNAAIFLRDMVCYRNFIYGNMIFFGEIKKYVFFLNSSVFLNNSAIGTGGVFKFYCTFVLVEHYAFISFSVFAGNSAARGAILSFENYNCSLRIDASIVINNTGVSAGGFATSFSGYTINISLASLVFVNNFAPQGAVLNLNGGSFFDYNSSFVSNRARIASCIYVTGGSNLILLGTKLLHNFATESGNMVFNYRCYILLVNIIMKNSTSAYKGAGITSLHHVRIYVISSVFKELHSSLGALLFSANCSHFVSFINCTFSKIESKKSIVYLFFSKLWLWNVSFGESRGGHFKLINTVVVHIYRAAFVSTYCGKGQFGCFLNADDNCKALIFKSAIKAVKSDERLDYISLTDSSILFFLTTIESLEEDGKYFIGVSGSLLIMILSSFKIYEQVFIKAKNSALSVNLSTFSSVINPNKRLKARAVSAFASDVFLQEAEFSRLTDSVIFMQGKKEENLAKNTLVVLKSSFFENEGDSGAVLILNRLRVFVAESRFSYNKAYHWGGCAFLSCEQDLFLYNLAVFSNTVSEFDTCSYMFFNNAFEANSAGKGGGAIFWRNSLPVILPPAFNIFSENSSPYGDVVASQGIYVELENKEILKDLNQVESGVIMNKSMEFTIRDFYSQIVTIHEFAEARIKLSGKRRFNQSYLGISNSTIFLLGDATAVFESGRFRFKNLRIIGLPTTPLAFEIETNFIVFCTKSFLDFTGSHFCSSAGIYAYSINLTLAPCRSGQIFQSNKLTCSYCDQGSFSFLPASPDEICRDCPPNAKCLGGDLIYTKKGYWRPSNSSTIYRCRNPYSCIGGTDNLCLEGFSGILCHLCKEELVGNGEVSIIFSKHLKKNWYLF